VILFAHTITSRLNYITRFIGGELGIDLQLTSDSKTYYYYDGPRINYSNKKITGKEIWIEPHQLLFENGIKEQDLKCFPVNGNKAFFATQGDLPFDVLAASFYLLSRYEEYLPGEEDQFGRYDHKNSIAFKEEFLTIPLVNIWLIELERKILEIFPEIHFKKKKQFSFLPTYDIDESYSYKYKSWWRNSGAITKAIVRGQWDKIKERREVIANKKNDPYDSYDWMDHLHEKFSLKPKYFFLVAQRTARYDRNILPGETAQTELIRRHSKKYEVGIHPSWQSGESSKLLEEEIRIMECATGRNINLSRQHFIRFKLPGTFRRLINAGIKEDHSMGYGSINGFRASVASPFYWYDLEREDETPLMLIPFCFMEANSFYEQKFTPAQALDELRHYYKVVKDVNGLLVTLWHNTFLGTDPLFSGWRNTYEQFISEIHKS
jgi:hypothetical protein